MLVQILEAGYERVFTVVDYYDGPREGVANYDKRPHHYKSEWDEDADDWAEFYILTPVSDEYFAAALESWEIWLRYERALHSGDARREDHPALPEDQNRHSELKAILESQVLPNPDGSTRMCADFLPIESSPEKSQVGMRPLQVRWRPPHAV